MTEVWGCNADKNTLSEAAMVLMVNRWTGSRPLPVLNYVISNQTSGVLEHSVLCLGASLSVCLSAQRQLSGGFESTVGWSLTQSWQLPATGEQWSRDSYRLQA